MLPCGVPSRTHPMKLNVIIFYQYLGFVGVMPLTPPARQRAMPRGDTTIPFCEGLYLPNITGEEILYILLYLVLYTLSPCNLSSVHISLYAVVLFLYGGIEVGFHLGEAVEGALWGYGAALMPGTEGGQVETELVGGEQVVFPAYHLVFLYAVIYYVYYILHGEVVGVAIVVYGAWRVAVPVAIAGREFPLLDEFVTIGIARCVVCFAQLLKFLFLLAHSVFYFFVFSGHDVIFRS